MRFAPGIREIAGKFKEPLWSVPAPASPQSLTKPAKKAVVFVQAGYTNLFVERESQY
jgi:hypothetical protein